jgi:Zn-dependent peptidase ImmA (M78 family)
LCEFLEEKGIKICSLDLPENVSGVQAQVKTANGRVLPVIVLNRNHAGERQRFTLAHELAHMFLKCEGSVNIEKACNRFAGAFLIPGEMLIREVGLHRKSISIRELFQLKPRFGASAQAIVYRCKDLGVISSPLYVEVFKIFTANGWRVIEPNPLVAQAPSRFERLCFRALAEGVISESKAAELLRTSVRTLEAMIDKPPERDASFGDPSGL